MVDLSGQLGTDDRFLKEKGIQTLWKCLKNFSLQLSVSGTSEAALGYRIQLPRSASPTQLPASQRMAATQMVVFSALI
jgi:hypothetical protein